MDMDETYQKQQVKFKSTSWAMESTLYWKPSPASSPSAPSSPKGLGQEIWTCDATSSCPVRSRLERMHREADAILESIISERRANSASASKTGKNEEDDLLGVLLNLQDHGNLEFQLTTSTIKAIILFQTPESQSKNRKKGT
ncbi:hypothetical protein D5086_022046 [Populus alba]|uniref:Uncharacterized protein n=1 Tax=Populus alba TaxID=43335 RepID=A0ACC4BDW3_POPAL